MNKILSEIHPSKLTNSVSDSILVCRMFAKIIGLWPTNFYTSRIQTIIKFSLNCICYVTLIFVLISSILDVSIIIQDLKEKLRVIGPLSFLFFCLTKYTILMRNSAKIEKCVKSVNEDWRIEIQDHQNVMMKNANYGFHLTILSAIFMYAGGFWFSVLKPLMAQKIVTEANLTIKPYPFSVYGSFVKNGYSPIYEIVFASHLITEFVACTVTVSCFSIAAVLTMHACGQLEIVTLYLNDLVNGDKQKGKTLQNRLVTTVNHHLKALRFISYLEDLLSEICLVEVFGSTLCICLLGYYIITAWNQYKSMTLVLTYSTLLSSFVFNIFMYCYIGEALSAQAEKVGQCAYMIDWYLLPKGKRLDMIFVIQVTLFPVKISAGKIIILSMSAFNSVIRSSAAYLNMLWRLT